MKTTNIKVFSPGKGFNFSRAKRVKTIDANPLGPNQPMNNTVSRFTLVLIRDRATGSMRIRVKPKIA